MDTADDQLRLNYAIYSLHIKWLSRQVRSNHENTGIVEKSGLKVVVLPTIHMCRKSCLPSLVKEYYVWHEVGGKHNSSEKASMQRVSKVWFLRKQWRKLANYSKLSGRAWLIELTDDIHIAQQL